MKLVTPFFLALFVVLVFAQNNDHESSITSLCISTKTETNQDLDKLCDLLNKSHGNNQIMTAIHSENEQSNDKKEKPSQSLVWGYGILCVTIISCMSVLGVSFLPLMSKSFYDHLLTVFIGLAVGSLSGSALFHLIPSAFRLADVTVNHSYLEVSLVIWFGIYLFFMIERFMKIFMESHNRKKGIDTGPTHQPFCSEDDEPKGEGHCAGNIPTQEVYEHSKAAMRASFGHMERPDNSEYRPTVETIRGIEKSNRGSKIATVAWMIIFGDGVHNFIDGLSIGAAFSESILTGISISAAVLCEEFPHELGDFAVLLKSGMNMRQAMVYNFLSACTCYIGLILGILLGEMHIGNQYIFAAAGGMFLYIALVDMVPELNATLDQLSKQSVKSAFFVFLLQNIGILTGIFSLFLLAKFQDKIQIDF